MHFSKSNDPDPEKLSAEYLFNEERVWQQLEKKISRPRRRKASALMAAASVLIVSGIAVWNLNTAPVATAINPVVTQPLTLKAIPVNKSKEKENDKSVVSTEVTRKTKQPAAEKIGIETAGQAASPIDIVQDTSRIHSATASAIMEPAKQAAPRRFRIAHVNDLTPPTVFTANDPLWSLAQKSYAGNEFSEVTGQEPPVKQKGIISLLRTNQ